MVEHTPDYPKDVDEQAVQRILGLIRRAQDELRKMSSDCLCYPGEWDGDEYIGGSFSDLDENLDDAFFAALDISEDTELDYFVVPQEGDIDWSVNEE